MNQSQFKERGGKRTANRPAGKRERKTAKRAKEGKGGEFNSLLAACTKRGLLQTGGKRGETSEKAVQKKKEILQGEKKKDTSTNY